MSGGIGEGYSDGTAELMRVCPWCFGNGKVVGKHMMLRQCRYCSGNGFLSRSEYNALIKKDNDFRCVAQMEE